MWKYLFLITSASAFLNPYPKTETKYAKKINSEPLVLTPYIENGNIAEARSLSLVKDLSLNISSYSGFFTIDKECESNIFFWFFPSQHSWQEDPLSIWLNGGPGSSSLYGMFTENGPYILSLDGKLIPNEYSWNRNSSIIYIDNPVNTGFSYSVQDCYATTEEEIGQGILNVLQQFFKLFPELSPNPFFLTGESYAGKYLPAIAHAIHTSENKSGINLQGVAIGNGYTDPVNQLNYGDYLYQLGLIDEKANDVQHSYQKMITSLIEEGNYSIASDVMDEMRFQFMNVLGFQLQGFYNYLYANGKPEPDIGSFVNQDEVRDAIHVGNATYHNADLVDYYLRDDKMRSVRPWVEELLDNDYQVLLYSGQLDIVIAYPLTLNYVQKLNWKGADDYEKAEREIWYVEDEVAGYSKTVRNFAEVLVRDAGHMVPTDQPKWALDLYNRFIFNKSLKN